MPLLARRVTRDEAEPGTAQGQRDCRNTCDPCPHVVRVGVENHGNLQGSEDGEGCNEKAQDANNRRLADA